MFRCISVVTLSVSFILSGCASSESVKFSALANQSAIVRDGRPALVSKMRNSIILVSPAERQFKSGARPIFLIAATNMTKTPFDLQIANINVSQILENGNLSLLPVVPFETLVHEERRRQIVTAILVGVAAGANAAAVANSGNGTFNANVAGPYGTQTVSGTYFSPTANAIGQANANAANDVMISNAIETGRQNMAAMEQNVLKDNTVMPGEWIGGQVFFTSPEQEGTRPKSYTISINFGGEIHNISVSQSASGQ